MPKIRISENWPRPQEIQLFYFFDPFWAFVMQVARDHNLCHASKSWQKRGRTVQGSRRALWKPIEIPSKNATYAFECDPRKCQIQSKQGSKGCTHKGQSLDETLLMFSKTLQLLFWFTPPSSSDEAHCSALSLCSEQQWAHEVQNSHAFSSHI